MTNYDNISYIYYMKSYAIFFDASFQKCNNNASYIRKVTRQTFFLLAATNPNFIFLL